MRVHPLLGRLSKRAPVIVIFALCVSLFSAWTAAPTWLPNSLSIVVVCLALALFASRERRHRFKTAEELGFSKATDWIAYELAGKGTPAGSYLLGFFCIVTIVLTGIQSSYAILAWAAFALGFAWGIANARFPVDEESER